MKLAAGLTPMCSGGDRGSPGGGGGSCGCGDWLIPGEVVVSVVSLAQWTPPPMVEGVLTWWEPVLVLDPRVSVCSQHLHTRTALKLIDYLISLKSSLLCHTFYYYYYFGIKASPRNKTKYFGLDPDPSPLIFGIFQQQVRSDTCI